MLLRHPGTPYSSWNVIPQRKDLSRCNGESLGDPIVLWTVVRRPLSAELGLVRLDPCFEGTEKTADGVPFVPFGIAVEVVYKRHW